MVNKLQLEMPQTTINTPNDLLLRGLFESNSEALYTHYYDYIHNSIEYFSEKQALSRHHAMLKSFGKRFDDSFNLWRQFLSYIGTIPKYSGVILDLLCLGMWNSAYANDLNGKLSPFGPWLADLGKAMEGQQLGVIHAFEQQLSHPLKEDLAKAQSLANELYDHLLQFLSSNDIDMLKADYEFPPLIQLYPGGAVTWLKDFPVPTIIAMNLSKALNFSGFSALPHEFGHDLSGTFKGTALVEEIIAHVKGLELPYNNFWPMWIEECFADAIGVATIREGEIFSLANLFSNYYTNIIFVDESGKKPDEHPNRHLRVLLAIEVGRILGLDSQQLAQTEKEWIAFGKKMNTAVPPDKIYDQYNNQLYPVKDFLEAIKPVTKALVDTTYQHLNGKKVKDIFADFDSALADEMKVSITEKKWLS